MYRIVLDERYIYFILETKLRIIDHLVMQFGTLYRSPRSLYPSYHLSSIGTTSYRRIGFWVSCFPKTLHGKYFSFRISSNRQSHSFNLIQDIPLAVRGKHYTTLQVTTSHPCSRENRFPISLNPLSSPSNPNPILQPRTPGAIIQNLNKPGTKLSMLTIY